MSSRPPKKHNPKLAPRIIAGKFKGMRLAVPSSARPFTDRVKQSVFDTISNLIVDAQVLDLFAGSGNLGLEALSRGAQSAVFVEIDKEARTIIADNCFQLGVSDQVKLVQQPVAEFLGTNHEQFDLIFLDPPFELMKNMSLKLLSSAMHADSVAVLKVPKRTDMDKLVPGDLQTVHVDELGQNIVMYLRKQN